MNESGAQKKKKTTLQKVLITFISLFSFVLLIMGLWVVFQMMQRPDSGQGDTNQDAIHDTTPGDSTEPTHTPRPPQIIGVESYNPLTGLPMDLGLTRNRPLAIVLNNMPEALPMNGISQADIVYEVPVEGGYTRTLAIFQDLSDVAKVGSIRSARLYTAEITESYDAIFVSAGSSPQSLTYIRQQGIPHLNEVEGPHREIFFRDRNRVSGRRFESLHSVVTTNERVAQWLHTYDFRLEHLNDFEHTLSFVEDGTPQGGSDANEVVVRFSGAKATTFFYDPDEGAYFVQVRNSDLIDANDNSRAMFTNILILNMSVAPIRGDESGRLDIVTTGTGEGYFVNGGRYIEISWHRPDRSSQFSYTLRDGTPLELGIGRTYICILPNNISPIFN